MRKHRHASFKHHQRSRRTRNQWNSHPENTNIIISALASNRDPEIWGSDSFEWIPERWMSASALSVAGAPIPGVYSNLWVIRIIVAFANTDSIHENISGWHLGAVGELACVYLLLFSSLFHLTKKPPPTADSNSPNSKWVCWIHKCSIFFWITNVILQRSCCRSWSSHSNFHPPTRRYFGRWIIATPTVAGGSGKNELPLRVSKV